MTDVVIAASEADAQAAEAVERHHAEMSGALAAHTNRLLAAASRPDPSAAEDTRQRLVAWCRTELLPHARAEEDTLYAVARGTTEGSLLVAAMVAEHELIIDLVRQIDEAAGDPVRAAATATALRAVFEYHLSKENELVLPLLLRTPGVSVAGLLDGMHELLGEQPGTAAADGCASGHTCGCGDTDPAGHPELDARTIPHAIRHATIFGALETVRPGAGLVLVAPHDPLPLLAQVSDRWPGAFTVDYLDRGPETWRLLFTRGDA